MNRPKCAGTTKTGAPCGNLAAPASAFCERHRDQGEPAPASTSSPLAGMPLATKTDALAILNALRRALLAGEINDRTHTSAVSGVRLAMAEGLLFDDTADTVRPREPLPGLTKLSLEDLAALVDRY